jgi:hypothetical protein
MVFYGIMLIVFAVVMLGLVGMSAYLSKADYIFSGVFALLGLILIVFVWGIFA